MSTPPMFNELELTEIHAETPELTHLELRPDPDFLAAYKTPGQYVQVKTGDHKPGFFALSSGPGEKKLSLLIKGGNPAADAILATNVGGTLQVSAPAGAGYPFDEARGRDLFLIGVGSGMAPLRAVIHAVMRDRETFKRVCFIYGARTQVSFPYQAEVGAWAEHDIDVRCVCSQPQADQWTGRVGRVQQCLLQDFTAIAPDSMVFVCGMKAMVEGVKSAFGNLGLPPERVRQNF